MGASEKFLLLLADGPPDHQALLGKALCLARTNHFSRSRLAQLRGKFLHGCDEVREELDSVHSMVEEFVLYALDARRQGIPLWPAMSSSDEEVEAEPIARIEQEQSSLDELNSPVEDETQEIAISVDELEQKKEALKTPCGLQQARRLAMEAALSRAKPNDSSDDDEGNDHDRDNLESTVSTLLSLVQIVRDAFEEEKSAARDRENKLHKSLETLMARLESQSKTMNRMNEEAQKQALLLTQVREEARDTERKLLNRIGTLEQEVQEVKVSLNDTQTELSESNAKLSRQLNDIKSMSISRNKAEAAAPKKITQPGTEMKSKQLGEEVTSPLNNSETRDEKKKEKQREDQSGKSPPGKHTTDEVRNANENLNEWIPSFADHARKPKKSSPPQRTAAAEDGKKKPLGKLLGVAKVKKTAFYVGGISPDCATEDFEEFCAHNRCPIVSCRLMRSAVHGTQAAYVVVREDDSKMFANIEWPQNLYCRPWSFKTTTPSLGPTVNNLSSSGEELNQQ